MDAAARHSLRVAMTVEQSWHRVPGGTATSVLRTMEALARRDDVVLTAVAATHRHPPPAGMQPPVPVRHLPLPRRVMYESWHTLRWPPVQLATGEVDVVHATTSAIPPRRGPLVVTVHDLAFLHAPEHFTRHGNRFFRRGLALTRRDADLVLVPSEDTAADCRRAGIPAERLRLVPHGVRVPTVSEAEAAAARRRHGLTRPSIMWCGTLEPRKNLRTLLEAFATLVRQGRQEDLVLVGPTGWGDALPDVDVDPDRVRGLGFVEDQELHALYAGARVFAYPSLREGFGLPVLEAMAHGVPVVTSAGTPMADLVGDAGIAVPATDPDALARALVEALDDGHDALALAARPRAATFSWDAAADLTVAAYRDAAGTA